MNYLIANFNQTLWKTCLGMEIQFVQIKGLGPFRGPIKGKIRKIMINIKKSSFHEPLAGMH